MAHSSLRNHRKLKILSKRLGIPPAHAAGHLEFFWWACYESVGILQDGTLEGWTEEHIEAVAEWAGGSGEFAKAMVEAGFLDPEGDGYRIHDYARWAPDYVKRRWRRISDNGISNIADRTCPTSDQTRPEMTGPPNPTQPNPKKPKKKQNPPTPLPASLDTEVFRAAWAEWLQHLKEKRKPPTPTAQKSQIRKLEKLGHDQAIDTIRNSIDGSYQGLWQPPGGQSQGTRKGPKRKTAEDRGEYAEDPDISDCILPPGGDP